MADPEGAGDVLEEKSDVPETLRVKLTTMNNELQDTLKMVETYKEDKRVAVNTKTELEESKKQITVLQTKLSESESNCRRYRNERNNLKRDIANLIQEKKEMVSYEEEVRQLKREIETQKDRYDRNDRDWRNKLTDTENRYDEIINEQKEKVQSSEQEVRQFKNELEQQKTAHEQDKRILERKQKESEETNQDADKKGNNDTEQKEEEIENRDGKINKHRNISENRKHGNTGRIEDSTQHVSDDNIDRPEGSKQDTVKEQNHESEQDKEFTEKQDNEDVIEKQDRVIVSHRRISDNRKYDYTDGNELTEKFQDSTTQLDDVKNGEAEFISEEPETNIEDSEKIERTLIKDGLTGVKPDSSDSSDTASPKDLAIRYAALYDKQWADAYEQIRQHFDSEKEVIEALQEILQDIMIFCKNKAQEQIDDLYRVLTFSSDQEDEYVSGKITKHLKECMREMSSMAKEYLYELYPLSLRKKSSRTLQYLIDIEEFVKECFELFWLMVIQEPPVVFCHLARENDVFDSDVYKPYKTTGRYVTFIVFPALLLHEDGPVLTMGVAEGGDQRRGKQKQGLSNRKKIVSKSVNRNINDISDYEESGNRLRRDELKYGERYNFDSRNETIVSKRGDFRLNSEHDLDDLSESMIREEMKFDERSDFIAKNRGDFRNKPHFPSEDEMRFHDRGDFVSRHEMGSGDKGNRSDFVVYEEKTFGDRDDFVQKGIKEIDLRGDYISKDQRDYRGIDDLHTTTLYETNSQIYQDRTGSTSGKDIFRNADIDSYHRARIAEDETRSAYSQSTIKTKSRGTTNVWKPSCGYERNPTPDEMRLYHQYIDRNDHTSARDVLGNAAYLRCLRNDHRSHLYH